MKLFTVYIIGCVYQAFASVTELISFYRNNPIELAEPREFVKLTFSPPN